MDHCLQSVHIVFFIVTETAKFARIICLFTKKTAADIIMSQGKKRRQAHRSHSLNMPGDKWI